jgi:hypothetical protein
MSEDVATKTTDESPSGSPLGVHPIVPKRTRLNLEETVELFGFLQGNVPEGYTIPDDRIPQLTADQAWTVVWYLGNLYKEVNDEIERCDVCGTIFDSASDGMCLDFGDSPYHFCDSCEWSDEYAEKLKQCPNDFHKAPVDGETCPQCCEMYEEPS